MGRAAKLFLCSAALAGISWLFFDRLIDYSVNAQLDGRPATADAYFMQPKLPFAVFYPQFRGMHLESEINSRINSLGSRRSPSGESPEDELMRYYRICLKEGTHYNHRDQSQDVLEKLASLETEKSLEYLVTMIYKREFDWTTRRHAVRLMTKKRISELRARPDLCEQLRLSLAQPEDGIMMFDETAGLLAAAGYRRTEGTLLAIAKNRNFSRRNCHHGYNQRARVALMRYPSRQALDLLIDESADYITSSVCKDPLESMRFGIMAMSMGRTLGMKERACSGLTPVMEAIKEYESGWNARSVLNGCGIIFTDH